MQRDSGLGQLTQSSLLLTTTSLPLLTNYYRADTLIIPPRMQNGESEGLHGHSTPEKEPLVIDISGGLFRGSGAMFQTDRLTIGRTGNKYLVKGADQVVEKVIFKENKEAEQKVAFLEAQVRQLLLKLTLVSAECQRLAQKPSIASTDPNAHLQINRLHDLLRDKEAELLMLRSAKQHESSDSTVRIAILAQENERLQGKSQTLLQKQVSLEHKVQQAEKDSIFRPENMTRMPIVADLAKMLESRDNELTTAAEKIGSLNKLLSQKSDALKLAEGKAERLDRAYRDKERELSLLQNKLQGIEKQAILQAEGFSDQSTKLRRNLESLEQEVSKLTSSEANLTKRLGGLQKELQDTKQSLSVVSPVF